MSQDKTRDDSNQNSRITWEGCSVLLDINDGDRLVFARLTAASTLKIGNKNFSLQPLIGCPFGSLFQVVGGTDGPFLSRVLPTTEGNNEHEKNDFQMKDEFKDNRALVDNNTAQNLTGEDIDGMRRQGATGNEIIEALISNSATYNTKTAFSQEKYRVKKQKKYVPKVLLRRPFARSICEAYFKKYPARIGFLRVDTLSLLLSMANITANSNVLLMDRVGGIVTGAVAERLGGIGFVCNTYLGVTPYPIDIVRIFNLNNEICKRIVSSPLAELTVQHGASSQTDRADISRNSESQPCDMLSPSHPQSPSIEETTLTSDEGVSKFLPETAATPDMRTFKATKAGAKAPAEALRFWRENGFSSLIIAAPDLDTWAVVKELLPLLSFSAPFAVYHQYLQPLAMCMHNLQLGKMAIGLQISEPWLREYQVLPSRTHPHMQMSAFGGYILSGTRICNSDQS